MRTTLRRVAALVAAPALVLGLASGLARRPAPIRLPPGTSAGHLGSPASSPTG